MSASPLRIPAVCVLGVSLGLLAACQSPLPNAASGEPAVQSPAPAPGNTPSGAAAPSGAGTAPGAPAQPARQFQLGAAANALVGQAHRQAASGDLSQAQATIERALRIEADNPLLWLELAQLHEAAGQYQQADGIARKALQLASGDPRALAAAWRLIAQSLRARNRTAEAAEADSRANSLALR
jgi:tetratricopeptide (TPR) repeat protein